MKSVYTQNSSADFFRESYLRVWEELKLAQSECELRRIAVLMNNGKDRSTLHTKAEELRAERNALAELRARFEAKGVSQGTDAGESGTESARSTDAIPAQTQVSAESE